MGLKIGDNFAYQGKKPNFERDQFTTKAAMSSFPEASIDEGHLAYCMEDGKRYEYKSSNPVDPTTGKWREYKTIVQATGQSETAVMSQKAVTEELTRVELTEYKYFPTPISGNLLIPENIITGYYVNESGKLSKSERYGIVYVPMRGKDVSTNVTGGAFLAACDKYGNITHVNSEETNKKAYIEYVEGDEYAIVSISIEFASTSVISYGKKAEIFSPQGFASNASIMNVDKKAFDGLFMQYTELDAITTTGVYKRDVSQGAYGAEVVIVTNDKGLNIITQTRILPYTGFTAIREKKNGGEWTQWEEHDVEYFRKNILKYNPYLGYLPSNDLAYNLFNKATALRNKYLGNNGVEYENTNYVCSDFIPFCKEMKELTISVNKNLQAGGGAFYVWYDINRKVISAEDINSAQGHIRWKEGTAFIRASIADVTDKNFEVAKIQIEIGSKVTAYVPYGISVKQPKNTSNNELQVMSILGQQALKANKPTVSANEMVTIDDFPYHIKKGIAISFFAKITPSFNGLTIGKGWEKYRGSYIQIDNTNVKLLYYQDSVTTKETFPHSLQFNSFIKGSIFTDSSGVMQLILMTEKGLFKQVFKKWGYEANYALFFKNGNGELSDLTIGATCTDFKLPVWAIGDSYFGIDTERWPGVMRGFGFFNLLINGLAGQDSPNAYNDLVKMLKFGTPKYLLWCLGMNDRDDLYKSTFDKVKNICQEKNITLVASTIPSVPERQKEAITLYVKESGVRYIDFAKAVGSNAEGVWYEGYLNSIDKVHPTAEGAKALATQVFVDFPEIMQYGLVATTGEIGHLEGDH